MRSNPEIRIIAPWRDWDLNSRESLLAYAQHHGIPIERKHGETDPYSMDANLLHISYEGGILEDPWCEPPEDMWRWSVSPEHAPDQPTYVDLEYRRGDIVAVDGQPMKPPEVLARLNELGGANGIGRLDIVENRYVGMKSRGCYETPGGSDHAASAHRAIESITLDREVAHLKDELMPRYACLIYNGYWWSPERRLLQQMIDALAGAGQRHGAGETLQGQRDSGGAASPTDSLFDADDRHLRGRRRRLQPAGRRGFHQAQRAAHADRGRQGPAPALTMPLSAAAPALTPTADVLCCGALAPGMLADLLGRYRLRLAPVPDESVIPGSYWGDSEAGLIGATLYLRADTPVHSALHEACHYVCMDRRRRRGLDTDAGGDYAEENAVCYLQILLAGELAGVGRQRLQADMDAWGYSFRLGSAAAWFDRDAEDARQWLLQHGLIDGRDRPLWRLRQ